MGGGIISSDVIHIRDAVCRRIIFQWGRGVIALLSMLVISWMVLMGVFGESLCIRMAGYMFTAGCAFVHVIVRVCREILRVATNWQRGNVRRFFDGTADWHVCVNFICSDTYWRVVVYQNSGIFVFAAESSPCTPPVIESAGLPGYVKRFCVSLSIGDVEMLGEFLVLQAITMSYFISSAVTNIVETLCVRMAGSMFAAGQDCRGM
mmetsp:Transcript_59287/g.70743  ORF Transcript_59287/g.70743 Transcript_59287/m.70743 type:complete len:206 (+) Transcript_59287:220-837(+)